MAGGRGQGRGRAVDAGLGGLWLACAGGGAAAVWWIGTGAATGGAGGAGDVVLAVLLLLAAEAAALVLALWLWARTRGRRLAWLGRGALALSGLFWVGLAALAALHALGRP